MRAFSVIFLPVSALAGAFCATLSGSLPVLSAALAVLMALAGFVLAVRAAAAGRFGAGRATVRHILAMREGRLRLACRFAAVGTAVSLAVRAGVALTGRPFLAEVGVAAAALLFALLFVIAWLVIGETACRNRTIRQALLDDRLSR
jgi:hypothetical protein